MNTTVREDIHSLLSRSYETGEFKNATVLIAGANSQIARFLTYLLMELNIKEKLGMKFVLLARNIRKAEDSFAEYIGNDNITLIEQDLSEPLNYSGPADFIFHSGGSSSPYHYANDPVGIIRANTVGTINILEFARHRPVKNILFASTREVYGDASPESGLICETDIGLLDHRRLRSCYPESKKLAESAFTAYAAQYGVPYSILRIASVYGPEMILENDGRAIADVVAAAVNSRNIVLTGSGLVVRGYCYISDVADGILRVMAAPPANTVYNLSNETELMQLRDIAALVCGLFPERKMEVIYENVSDAPLKNAYSTAEFVPMNTSRLETLGWKPTVSFADGLRRTIISYGMYGDHNA